MKGYGRLAIKKHGGSIKYKRAIYISKSKRLEDNIHANPSRTNNFVSDLDPEMKCFFGEKRYLVASVSDLDLSVIGGLSHSGLPIVRAREYQMSILIKNSEKN